MWTLDLLSKIRLSHDGRKVECGDEVWNLPTPEDIMEWFRLVRAGWVWNGDPKMAHVVLHSERHSVGFFLCKVLLKFGNLREIIAACMVERLKAAGLERVDGVFGAPYSSIKIAGDVGRLLRVPDYTVEKGPKDPKTNKDTMVFKPDDPISEGSVLLPAEELITTRDSETMAEQAILAGNPYPVKFTRHISVFVYRPQKIELVQPDGRIIVPFVSHEVDSWDPKTEVCPPCAAGSEAVKPKGENWAKLLV